MPSPRAILRVSGAVALALVRVFRTIVVVGFATSRSRCWCCVSSSCRRSKIIAARWPRCCPGSWDSPVEIAVLNTVGMAGTQACRRGLPVLERARKSDAAARAAEARDVVAWTSVPLLELRLKELVIEGPRLAIRRDRSGVLRIAGLEFDPARAEGESALADWILQQSNLETSAGTLFGRGVSRPAGAAAASAGSPAAGGGGSGSPRRFVRFPEHPWAPSAGYPHSPPRLSRCGRPVLRRQPMRRQPCSAAQHHDAGHHKNPENARRLHQHISFLPHQCALIDCRTSLPARPTNGKVHARIPCSTQSTRHRDEQQSFYPHRPRVAS